MTTVLLNGEEIELEGGFLKEGNLAPDFVLCSKELETKTLESFQGKKKVIATLPSIDTPVCEAESIEINKLALQFPSVLFLIVSKDLPFSFERFCKKAQMNNIVTLSDVRSRSNFGKDYGVRICSGPLDGLLARSVMFLDESDKVLYSELVPDVKTMPNFDILKGVIESGV